MPQPGFRPLLVAVAVLTALVACGDRDASGANDPNKPAVVQAPPVILRSDTAAPDTSDATEARVFGYRGQMLTIYSVLSTAINVGDARTAMSIYEPDAVFETPDSTVRSSRDAVRGFASLMVRSKTTEMRRNSLFITILPDSVVSDSGFYVFATRRDTVATTVVQGWYKTLWRLKPDPVGMVIRSDRLHAGKGYPFLKQPQGASKAPAGRPGPQD